MNVLPRYRRNGVRWREVVEGEPVRSVTVFDLFETAERMIEARLRRDNPAVTLAQIDAAVVEWSSAGDRHLGLPQRAPRSASPWTADGAFLLFIPSE